MIVSLLLFSTSMGLARTIALDVSVGAISPKQDFPEPHLDFTGHLWYPFDQMVFLGLGSGIQNMGDDRHIPLLGSISVRFPIGRQILPVATGDFGYDFGDDPQRVWRGGFGLDIKNGDRSSLLFLVGCENFAQLGFHWYVRGGLLLEW
ncbi:MAG TPA: hypothetical protein VLM37_06355 [Fibrobacteraceae bacterium]|nr:hypothetical protein [Fibrobacteraceae bacterium]